jgi:serine/threonine protein kinase/tetratricopeptide (TPR) repeat protein
MADWNPRANDIFLKAFSILAPAARSEYLDGACAGDTALRAQVDALVRASDGAGSFLEAPAADLVNTVDEPCRATPTRSIGPYKLLEQIGEGGMGTVFMAEQQHPVRRKVALKVLKPGMDSKQVIARFEAERQALALMDHHHIAHVFDGGATETGHPYFVMELVRGIPITAYCDQSRLTLPHRLELFVNVCQAVQHAHQKGIIHRDIKPSNVLVTLHDGTPVVKVIDFGIAKAIGQQLTDKTLFTGFAQMIGTPLYMSPEQAGMSGLDVDTRSDIYSLGVLLYELLTGATPFDRERLREADFDELRRIIREEEPPRPSARISTLGAGASTVSAQRQCDPRRLNLLLRRELDWIVMKCLDKDRNRRYETANDLAADVQRYLADEPVHACPPSQTYRLKKFLRRKKGPVLAASLVLLVLVGGIVGTTLGLFQAQDETTKAGEQRDRAKEARDAERRAKEAEKRQRHRAEKARVNEKRHRIQAVADRKQAVADRDRAAATLDAMTSSLVGHALTQQKALTREQKQFLITAMAYYRAVLKEQASTEAGKKRLAAAALRVGMIENRLGRRREAAIVLRQARDFYTQLTKDFPGVLEYREAGARSHEELAISLAELGIRDEAETEQRAFREILKELVAEYPRIPKYRQTLANSHSGMAMVLIGRRQWAQAAAEYRAAIDIEKQLVARYPTDPSYANNLANSREGLATMLQMMKQWDQAETEFRAVIEILKKLLASFPGHRRYRQNLVQTHLNLGAMLMRLGKLEPGDTELREALKIGKTLLNEFPGNQGYVELVGTTLHNLGTGAAFLRRPNDALAWFDQAIAVLAPVVAREPGLRGAREVLRNSHSARAATLDRLERYEEAAKHWEKAMKLSQGSDRTYRHYLLMMSRVHAGQLELAMKDADELAKVGAQGVLYNCACVYALAHAKTKDDKHGARAVALLRQAVARGWRDVAHLKKAVDLDSLRGRADFQQILAALKKKKAPQPPPKRGQKDR